MDGTSRDLCPVTRLEEIMRSVSLRLAFVLFACVAAVAAVAAGCSGSGDDDDDDDGAGVCADEIRDDDYVAGLQMTGASNVIVTTLDDAAPAPPDVGDNVWTVTANAVAGGAPLAGCSLEVTPFMPDHNHGSGTVVVVTTSGTAGEYHLEPIDLIMPGYWEITLDFACPGSLTDAVMYKFCAEG